MHQDLQTLIELAGMDRTAAETQRQLDRYPGMLAEVDAALAGREQSLAAARASHDAAKLGRIAAEKEALSLREKIAKLERQQASVKTAKEAEAMTAEIASLVDRIDARETEGLEHLLKEEEYADAAAKAQAMLARAREDAATERARIVEQTGEKTERLERLRIERGSWLAKLEAPHRTEYEKLHARYPGSALAKLDGQTCGECHWALTNNAISKARAHSLEAHCEHCGRLLYAK